MINQEFIKAPGTKISYNKGGGSVTITYNVSTDELWDYVPEEGSGLPEDIPQLNDLLLDKVDIVNNPAKRSTITCSYTPPAVYKNDNHDEGETETTLSSSLTEVDLERHPNYLYKWNHYLVATEGVNLPAWYDTAKDGTNEDEDYKWVKTKADAENLIATKFQQLENWSIIGRRTQPEALEAYFVPACEVTETTYWMSRKKALQAASALGTKETPTETYGRAGGEWLVMSASENRDGKYWVVTKTYQWAEKWSDDFYSS